MAASMSSKKVSRRRAMKILGSGTVVSAIWDSEDLEALDCTKPAMVSPVRTVPSSTRPGKQQGLLTCAACCVVTSRMIINPNRLSTGDKAHLKPIKTELEKLVAKEALEEFCVMIWGVTEKRVSDLQDKINVSLKEWYPAPANK